MKRSFVFLMLVSAAPFIHAQGVIYECGDAPKSQQGKNATFVPQCKKIALSDTKGVDVPVAKKSVAFTSAAVSPSNFPRVDEATQKARDSDRKQILQDETTTEQKKLADLRREFNNGKPQRRPDEAVAAYQQRAVALRDDVTRSEQNVEALNRELAKLR